MISPNAISPFTPGFGSFPPAFVGRERFEDQMLDFVRSVADPNRANQPLLIYGPRGNGKTALVAWLVRNRPRDIDVEVLVGDTMKINGFPALVAALDIHPHDATKTVHKTGGKVLGVLSGELVREASRPAESGNPAVLMDLLAERCQQRPLALVIDEAQLLEPGLGRFLIGAATDVSARAPFALAFVGTPGMVDHLLTIDGPSHADRCRHVMLGRLDAAATSQALAAPFENNDPQVPFDADALAQVAEATGCYPYFVQEWGDALWNAARRTGAERVSADIVEAARPAVEVKLATYYRKYHKEILAAGLIDQALALADAYARNGVDKPLPFYVVRGEMLAVTPDASAFDAIGIADQLRNIGYIWDSATVADHVEAGIPSLMSYIRAQERALRNYRGIRH